MKYIACEQGTPEWHKARAGLITASKFRDALTFYKTKPTEPMQCSVDYCHEVALERISGAPIGDGYLGWQMKRGQDEEPFGREDYEVDHGVLVQEAGVCVTDCGTFGYSTDGLVGDDGLIEIKSLVAPVKLVALWRTGNLDEWMHQIQGGLWITGRQWCDFICWAPQLRSVDKHLYVKRVQRDEAFINRMELDLLAFNQRVQSIVADLRKLAA